MASYTDFPPASLLALKQSRSIRVGVMITRIRRSYASITEVMMTSSLF
jgi:hypothetical protein